MDLRKRILIIIGSVILIVAIIFLFYYFRQKETVNIDGGSQILPPQTDSSVQFQQPTASTNVNTPVTEKVEMPKVDPDELYMKQISRIFVERFLSYSNQDDNQHIDEVLPMVTESMVGWIKKQALEFDLEYSGITTRVIASRLQEMDDEKAVVLVDVQQTIDNTDGQKVEYKSGRVNLRRVDDDWKIEGLYWD